MKRGGSLTLGQARSTIRPGPTPGGEARGEAPLSFGGTAGRDAPFALGGLLLAAVLLAPAGAAEVAPAALRYDLRPGDHLVYREQLEREADSSEVGFTTRGEWTSHVLVLAERAGSFRTGFQRNRERVELRRYREGGRERLAQERPAFEERLRRRPSAFAETNWIRSDGTALLPWSAVREAMSELLPHIHELPALPPRAGEAWTGSSLLGLTLRVAGTEAVQGEDCLRVESADEQSAIHLRYWHCPASGTMARLELEGKYAAPPSLMVHEKLTFERMERRRDEPLASWLAQPDLRRGALASLLVTEDLPAGPEALYSLLDVPDARVRRQVLALAYLHRVPPPPLDTLGALLGSDDARLRALTVRNLERVPADAAGPLVERALADADPFVRGAGRGWQWRRSTEAAAATPLAALARAVRGGEPLPEWSCGGTAGWAGRALREQRAPGQVTGSTLRFVSTGPFAGRPYVVHVPEDYRGDEPFPLLILLGGGPGRAIPTAQLMHETLEAQGYLAVFPQAIGAWWEKDSTAMVSALLRDVLGAFDVDTNRVYLAGFSNGGTGVILYASLWPDRLAAAASHMGAGLPFFRDDPPPAVNLAGLPFLFVHGDRDERIPSWTTLDTVKAIRGEDARAPLETHILKDRRHDVFLGQDDGLTLPFFARRERDPFPRRLRFRTHSVDFGRHYWVEVLGKERGLAEVDAEIGPDNQIELRTGRVTRLRLLLRAELLPAPGPVRVRIGGREVFAGALREDCARLLASWRETGDPFRAWSAEVDLEVPR